MEKFIGRLKKNLDIKKIDSNQPVKLWSFVILLNIIGFIGFLIVNNNHIGPGL